MPPEGSATLFGRVVSRRDARLLFWLVILSLIGVIFSLWTEFLVENGTQVAMASPADRPATPSGA